MADSPQAAAVVTGAARDIAYAAAGRLLQDGYAVAFLDCDAEVGVQAAQTLSADSTRWSTMPASSIRTVARWRHSIRRSGKTILAFT